MKKRIPRTQPKQYAMVLDHLELYPQMKTSSGDPHNLARLWDGLARKLNALGIGPQRTGDNWKRAISHWKSLTRAKARVIKQQQQGSYTFAYDLPPRRLSDLEERLLTIHDDLPIIDNHRSGFVDCGSPADDPIDESVIESKSSVIQSKRKRTEDIKCAGRNDPIDESSHHDDEPLIKTARDAKAGGVADQLASTAEQIGGLAADKIDGLAADKIDGLTASIGCLAASISELAASNRALAQGAQQTSTQLVDQNAVLIKHQQQIIESLLALMNRQGR